MAGDVALSGEIPAEGVGALLRTLEERRISGVVRFEVGGTSREVALLAGSLVEPSPSSRDDDALEALLGAQGGRYEVLAHLPPLPVSQGDARVRTGSLAVHVPADLMSWCERAGLSGTLTLLRDGERAAARYERGELLEIQVMAGDREGDLGAVFAWDEGTFRVEADAPDGTENGLESTEAAAPVEPSSDARAPDAAEAQAKSDDEDAVVESGSSSSPEVHAAADAHRGRLRDDATVPIVRPVRRDDTGQRFLRVVETTLGAIVDQAEKQRAPSRSSPPLPAASLHPPSLPPAPRAPRETTVRIVYVSGDVTPLDVTPPRKHEAPSAPSRLEVSRSHTPEAAPDSRLLSVVGLIAGIMLIAAFAALLLHAR
jgi:hypothetical protein